MVPTLDYAPCPAGPVARPDPTKPDWVLSHLQGDFWKVMCSISFPSSPGATDKTFSRLQTEAAL